MGDTRQRSVLGCSTKCISRPVANFSRGGRNIRPCDPILEANLCTQHSPQHSALRPSQLSGLSFHKNKIPTPQRHNRNTQHAHDSIRKVFSSRRSPDPSHLSIQPDHALTPSTTVMTLIFWTNTRASHVQHSTHEIQVCSRSSTALVAITNEE